MQSVGTYPIVATTHGDVNFDYFSYLTAEILGKALGVSGRVTKLKVLPRGQSVPANTNAVALGRKVVSFF